MAKPQRLQLSRAKGFDLQRISRETNGLAAVNVARPSKFGNPFHITDEPGSRETSIAQFRRLFERPVQDPALRERVVAMKEALPSLRGKNLACWCKRGEACHVDVLLELANR